MGPEHVWWGGMWFFPIIMPIIMLTAFLLVIYMIFGRGLHRPPWIDPRDSYPHNRIETETALEILKKRYAKGEITREEFEQMRKNIE